LVPCAVLTLKADRRWGALLAAISAILGPLISRAQDPRLHQADLMLWNMIMRFLTLEMCVLFVDRICRHKYLFRPQPAHTRPKAAFKENWAVVLASGLLLLVVAALDYVTDPAMTFLPFYLLPCMALTLALNLRWGILAALAASATTSAVQYLTDPKCRLGGVVGWNFIMCLAISLAVILLLDRSRKENILFFISQEEAGPPHAPPAGRGVTRPEDVKSQ
jgi:hypothetical protein